MNYEKEYFEQNYGVDNIADANIEYMKAEQSKIIEGHFYPPAKEIILVEKFLGKILQPCITWNDVMPVYQKVAYEWTNMSNGKQGQVKDIKQALQNRLVLGEINGVWQFCVEFIKWYNQTKLK